jgi:hypothetical protein
MTKAEFDALMAKRPEPFVGPTNDERTPASIVPILNLLLGPDKSDPSESP